MSRLSTGVNSLLLACAIAASGCGSGPRTSGAGAADAPPSPPPPPSPPAANAPIKVRTPAEAIAAPLSGERCAFLRVRYTGEALQGGATLERVEHHPAGTLTLQLADAAGEQLTVPVDAVRFDLPPTAERDFYASTESPPPIVAEMLPETLGPEVHVVEDCLAADRVYLATVVESPERTVTITEVGGAAESFTLSLEGNQVTASGQSWSYTGQTHKHQKPGQEPHGEWSFTVEKDGRKLSLAPDGPRLYAEGSAFGQIYVIEGDEGGMRAKVTLSAGTSRPLDVEAAKAMARQRHAADGHPEPTSSGVSVDEGSGTISLSLGTGMGADATRYLVGRYTKRIVSVRAPGSRE